MLIRSIIWLSVRGAFDGLGRGGLQRSLRSVSPLLSLYWYASLRIEAEVGGLIRAGGGSVVKGGEGAPRGTCNSTYSKSFAVETSQIWKLSAN